MWPTHCLSAIEWTGSLPQTEEPPQAHAEVKGTGRCGFYVTGRKTGRQKNWASPVKCGTLLRHCASHREMIEDLQ